LVIYTLPFFSSLPLSLKNKTLTKQNADPGNSFWLWGTVDIVEEVLSIFFFLQMGYDIPS
jgi:hypothetical protein